MNLNLDTITLDKGSAPASCECGCGLNAPLAKRNNARKGHAKGQPLRFVSGHNKRGTTDLTRYIVIESGCWQWTGSRNRKGYGRAQVAGEHTGAHRAMYEVHHGVTLPAGIHLDHLCLNVWCVNPGHLEPVTAAENRSRQAHARRRMIDPSAVRP